MTDDVYLIAITALLPLTALMLVLQVNPYQALVMRGILGAIAALVYALFGAADVALTEALVGTMLSITLYAVAVRSSMEMRLGWVSPDVEPAMGDRKTEQTAPMAAEAVVGAAMPPVSPTLDEALVTALRKSLKPHHLRLDILAYPSLEALKIALETKRIHTALLPAEAAGHGLDPPDDEAVGQGGGQPLPAVTLYRLQTRLHRLYEILNESLPSSFAVVSYGDLSQPSSPAAVPAGAPSPFLPSAQESP